MNNILILNSGIGIDLSYWCLAETMVDGNKMHAVIETSKLLEIDSEKELPSDLFRKINWMIFSETKHLNIQESDLLPPSSGLGLNSIFNFGLYKGYEVGLIYSLDPTYIEWCILNLNSFFIYDLEKMQKYGVVQLIINYGYRDLNTPVVTPFINAFKNIQELTKSIGMANIHFRLSDEAILRNKMKYDDFFQ